MKLVAVRKLGVREWCRRHLRGPDGDTAGSCGRGGMGGICLKEQHEDEERVRGGVGGGAARGKGRRASIEIR